VLDRLLAGGVAALVAQGVVALDVLAQDGLRVRAAAGAGSFRRRERLVELAAAATARVEQLRGELDADPAAGDRRQRAAHRRAAQQRAAREGEERVKAALDRMSELEAERTRREKTNKAEVMLRSARRARLEARPPRWSSAFAALNQFSDRLEKPVPTTKVDPGLCRESAKAISSCIN
jgi:hypothetical protein